MSVTPIRLFGDPVLRTPAEPVVDFDAELQRLVADLTDTMLDAGGAGLAAPQLGVGLRVFTYNVDGVLGHLVNPDLSLGDDETCELEGCLSLPGQYADVTRPARVAVRHQDADGATHEIEAEGLLAACLQHEIDHLDGVLFVDHLSALKRNMLLRKLAKERRQMAAQATDG